MVERILEKQGRTISWLADQCGLPVSTAWRMLKGERELTSEFKTAAAKALGVPEDLAFPAAEQAAL